MSVASIIPGPGLPLPPEPGLTPAEVVARAEAIAPTLVARQAETERRSYYAEDTHRAFTDAGFYRILVPRRYGGYEFGAETFVRVTMALARGCPSTAWMYCFGASHAVVVATLFDEAAQAELFAGGDFICPATVGPAGTAERAADGTWVVDGTWAYCSGAPYATHFLGHTLVSAGEGQPPAPMMFVVPREGWRRLDDWGKSLGLRGSGSHSIVVERARIPDRYTLPTHMSQYTVGADTPGHVLHANPEYAAGPLGFMFFEVAALAVGMATGALDAYTELMTSRTTLFPPIVGRADDPDYQDWYGEAAGRIATAEAALLGAVARWEALCARGPAGYSAEEDVRIATICREVVRLCWGAVADQLFPTAGSSAVREGERIERVWRDLSMVHSHAGIAVFLNKLANRALTQAKFAA
ncbi:MAG: acyl-CoA dehydrogenase family protein [Actinophytocola sp.]|uniref:acyl-CoA dehydrogenase family protein n=1 Tax=Actinophytocola sp. TaxID=1872138 RepID=UPI003D6A8626